MSKNLKRGLAIALSIGMLFVQSTSYAIEDGIYKLPIKLMKKYDNEVSMGNPALEQYGLLKVENGKTDMKVRFKPLSMFNFKGYLGEFTVKGEPVKILNVYDVIDGYNDPVKGIDAKFKGKKYPKDMEFPINTQENDIPVHVYVPVMGEMASGDQDARLRVAWPEDFNTKKITSYDFDNTQAPVEEIIEEPEEEVNNDYSSKDGRVLPALEHGDPLELEDGIYSVGVQLYHERENKPSMGNAAMVHEGEIVVKDHKPVFLLGSDKMKVQNIVASLVSLQIRDDQEYYHFAQPHAFDLVLEGEQEKRAEVFSFDINRKDPFIYVKVDPKVKPMGEKPIGARLKFDWNSLHKIDPSQAVLNNKVLNGTEKPKFDPNARIEKQSDDIILVAEPGNFDEGIRFKYAKINGGAKYVNFTKKLGRKTPVSMYEFKIESEYGVPLEPKNEVSISLPISTKVSRVVNVDDGSSISFNQNNGSLTINTKKLGFIAIISEAPKIENKPVVISNTKKNPPKKKTTTKPKTKTKTKAKTKETKKEPKKVEPKKEETKKPVTVLTNEKDDFEPQTHEVEYATDEVEVQEDYSTQENPKVIFFCILFLLAITSLAAYTYIKIGEKLLYEIRFSKILKDKLAETGGKNA